MEGNRANLTIGSGGKDGHQGAVRDIGVRATGVELQEIPQLNYNL